MIKRTILCVLAVMSLAFMPTQAQTLKDILGGLAGAAAKNDSAGSSNPLGQLGSVISGFVASDKFTLDELEGTWKYEAPSVSFESENALKKAGGAAASAAVEKKLEPYYVKLRLNATTLTVDSLHNFDMKLGVARLKGTVEKTDDGQLIFNFKALGKINLGKMSAHAKKAGGTLYLTFDSTRLVQILTLVGGRLNISTLNAITSLLNSYEGVYLGFRLKSAD